MSCDNLDPVPGIVTLLATTEVEELFEPSAHATKNRFEISPSTGKGCHHLSSVRNRAN